MLSGKLRKWLKKMVDGPPKRSQRSVATELGIPHTTVGRIIREERPGELRLDTLEIMAATTGYPAWYLLQCIEEGRPLPRIEREPPAAGAKRLQ